MSHEESKGSLEKIASKNEWVPDTNQEEGGFRPRTRTIPGGKFRHGDKVLLTMPGSRALQGPYLISKMVEAQMYELLSEDGNIIINNGQLYNEGSLSFA